MKNKWVKLSYIDDNGRKVSFDVKDWDAAVEVAEALVRAPIELDHLGYEDGMQNGIFNLNTFERC